MVEKVNAATGAVIWGPVYLVKIVPSSQATATTQWLPASSMAIGKNGNIHAAAGPHVFELNPSNGAIIKQVTVPILASTPPGQSYNTNLDGFQFAPDQDGTILLKSQARVNGCAIQSQPALFECPNAQTQTPPTAVYAINPDTLQVEADVLLNQAIPARPVVVKYKGTIYMYIAGRSTGTRVIWNPTTVKLTQDLSWAPTYLLPGQGPGDAPAVVGNWIVFNNDGGPSPTPMCATAVSQNNENVKTELCPQGYPHFQVPNYNKASCSEGSCGADPQKSMVFLNDWCSPWLFGASLDQATGKMTVKWALYAANMGDYSVMIGPGKHRVFVTQILNHPTLTEMFKENYNYTERLAWLNEETGKVLAETGTYPSTATGSLVNVGSAGRVYMMGNNGLLCVWFPVSCSKYKGPTNPPSTTTCSGPEPGVPPATTNYPLPQPQPAPPSQ